MNRLGSCSEVISGSMQRWSSLTWREAQWLAHLWRMMNCLSDVYSLCNQLSSSLILRWCTGVASHFQSKLQPLYYQASKHEFAASVMCVLSVWLEEITVHFKYMFYCGLDAERRCSTYVNPLGSLGDWHGQQPLTPASFSPSLPHPLVVSLLFVKEACEQRKRQGTLAPAGGVELRRQAQHTNTRIDTRTHTCSVSVSDTSAGTIQHWVDWLTAIH